jgi:hypothetical protein
VICRQVLGAVAAFTATLLLGFHPKAVLYGSGVVVVDCDGQPPPGLTFIVSDKEGAIGPVLLSFGQGGDANPEDATFAILKKKSPRILPVDSAVEKDGPCFDRIAHGNGIVKHDTALALLQECGSSKNPDALSRCSEFLKEAYPKLRHAPEGATSAKAVNQALDHDFPCFKMNEESSMMVRPTASRAGSIRQQR